MARLVSIALFLSFAPAAAWSQSAPSRDFSIPADAWRQSPNGQFRLRSDSQTEASGSGSQMFAGTELAPNAVLGIGAFGMKRERSYQAPVTVRDVATTRTRRPAVGVRLKF
jgi:hypothetical protein